MGKRRIRKVTGEEGGGVATKRRVRNRVSREGGRRGGDEKTGTDKGVTWGNWVVETRIRRKVHGRGGETGMSG